MLRERVAKALWDFEIREGMQRIPGRKFEDFAQWPEDAAIQPYCRSTYRAADAVLTALKEFLFPGQ